ncbi:MAG: DNA repair protein RadC [Desulfovibrionales bacterium]|nr:MAG: DNA repair protein RadC [Desulfovibrionales bacterium]
MHKVRDLLAELYAVEPACENLSHPEHVVVKMLPYRDRKIEYFVLFLLDNKNNVMARRVVSKGTVDQTPVYIREIMRLALMKQASGIIVAHNHPGGDPSPSIPDQELTRRLQKAAQVLDVRFLDHVIISRTGHYSFQAQGLL